MNNKSDLFKVLIISRLQSLSGLIEKCKLTLSKSDSSRDNLCDVRLVLVLLAVNVGRLSIKTIFPVVYLKILVELSC